jgi:nicotinate-nucleotide adenylyltransferase
VKNKSIINNIGLYFGSFNPLHIGHLIIASYIIDSTELDQIWFVISPHNPLKDKKTLLSNIHRLAMVNIAIEDNPKFRACDIEFNLPTPSYTINTLAVLKEKYHEKRFHLIMGEDNLESFEKWRNFEKILQNHHLFVYPRQGKDGGELRTHDSVTLVNAPMIEISSSFIRKSIKEKRDFRYYLPEKVYQYIREMHFYEK